MVKGKNLTASMANENQTEVVLCLTFIAFRKGCLGANTDGRPSDLFTTRGLN